MKLITPTPQVPRDRWERPMVLQEDGSLKPYRRVTTFIDVLDDKYNLNLWSQRMVALGLAHRPDLLLKAAANASDKKVLNETVEEAKEAAGATQAAITGSALHKLTEQVDRGEEPEVPPAAKPDMDAYLDLLQKEHLTICEVEVFVVYDGYKVGGTFDRIVEREGVRYVADLKTGTIEWATSKIAMQLSMYANSQRYDPSTGTRTSLGVDATRGLVLHLPAGSGEASAHWADLSIAWTGIELAKDVWDWRGLKGLLQADPPGPSIEALISLAADREALVALYRHFQASWSPSAQQAVEARIRALRAS